MISVCFPDGSSRSFEPGVLGREIATSISSSLAKKSVAIEVDGQMWDLTRPITHNCSVKIITKDDPQGLEVLRHDAAHVFAQAVKEMFPATQISIGPSIENGFYYDILPESPLSENDLGAIEEHMKKIVDMNIPIVREIWSRADAIDLFKKAGEKLKVEIIEAIPGDEDISLYRQGSFIDLCRGPHLPSTGLLGKSFKLMKIAGAYWRGDSNNIMLQRVYGTAWANDKQLQDYLTMLEEAERRDHRKLGKELDLFHLQEDAPGSVFWHPFGWVLYRSLQDYMRARLRNEGYREVNTPVLMDRSFWEASGHWEKFQENMFTTAEVEDKVYAAKPMNCPGHVQIFKQGIKSYRDLPLRLAEFGCCHRKEPSGSLHGIMRVRGFVQDDAHIFCTQEQIESETIDFCNLLKSVYAEFGFTDIIVKFSDRPDLRAGSDEVWDAAEAALSSAAKAAGLVFQHNPGEGAFYGPKLEFVIKDAIGRDWQCGTLQADFVIPERLGAKYVAEDGSKKTPAMLHRAICGSFERFIGILIEHYAGKFPVWMSPIQVAIVPITSDIDEYGWEIAELLHKEGIRVKVDDRNEKINYRIRELSHQKVPIILVVGNKEKCDKTATVRRLGSDTQETLALADVIDIMKVESRNPGLNYFGMKR
jgi:threonyl-tRNA synthetase